MLPQDRSSVWSRYEANSELLALRVLPAQAKLKAVPLLFACGQDRMGFPAHHRQPACCLEESAEACHVDCGQSVLSPPCAPASGPGPAELLASAGIYRMRRPTERVRPRTINGTMWSDNMPVQPRNRSRRQPGSKDRCYCRRSPGIDTNLELDPCRTLACDWRRSANRRPALQVCSGSGLSGERYSSTRYSRFPDHALEQAAELCCLGCILCGRQQYSGYVLAEAPYSRIGDVDPPSARTSVLQTKVCRLLPSTLSEAHPYFRSVRHQRHRRRVVLLAQPVASTTSRVPPSLSPPIRIAWKPTELLDHLPQEKKWNRKEGHYRWSRILGRHPSSDRARCASPPKLSFQNQPGDLLPRLLYDPWREAMFPGVHCDTGQAGHEKRSRRHRCGQPPAVPRSEVPIR